MIKQGVVQETLADMSAPLPPLNNLPQWARVNTLDKARYPKPFLKDRLQPLPNPNEIKRRGSMDSDDKELEIVEDINPMQKIMHLERSLNFLQIQHKEVLSNLHEEIDRLKRENKELTFKIVMLSKGSSESPSSSTKETYSPQQPPHPPPRQVHVQPHNLHKDLSSLSMKSSKSKPQEALSGHSQGSDEKIDELKTIFLEEEIKELKHALREEQNRNNYLTQVLEQAEKKVQSRQPSNLDTQSTRTTTAPAPVPGPTRSNTEIKMPDLGPPPIPCTTHPLQVHLQGQPPRSPTLQECEIIIDHLQQVNDQQAHELMRLKTDLRDVLYSHKWTPDAYLLAKAYVAEDDAREAAEQSRLPRLQLRNPTRKLPDIAYIHRDTVSLPALKQTMGNKAAERKKRTMILQKARMRREDYIAGAHWRY